MGGVRYLVLRGASTQIASLIQPSQLAGLFQFFFPLTWVHGSVTHCTRNAGGSAVLSIPVMPAYLAAS